MFNPITMLSGFSLSTKVLLIAGVFVAGAFTGYKVTTWRADANKLDNVQEQIATGTEIQKESAPIIEKKAEKEKEIQYVYRTIREKVNALPDSNNVCFSPESLILWNDAITGTNSDRTKSTRTTTGTNSAEADKETLIANVGEVLTNASENFQICNSNINKHKALISKIESLDGRMCVCSQ